MRQQLVKTSQEGHVYLAVAHHKRIDHTMEHLACFVPGMLALGVMENAVVDSAKQKQYLKTAEGIAETCWHMYDRQVTGLSPEQVQFVGKMTVEKGKHGANLLRPEAIESFWYLWRATGDWKYRAYGWAIFERFQRYCKVTIVGLKSFPSFEVSFFCLVGISLLPVKGTYSLRLA